MADESKVIEEKTKALAKDLTRCVEQMKAKNSDLPEVKFQMSRNKVSKVRTPEQQAQEVAKNKSWVCWSSHMADQARHVLMMVDGKASWDIKKTFGKEEKAFKEVWGKQLKKHGLKNAKGGDGWYASDGFHVELPDSKMSKDDKRAKACLTEYARITKGDREKGKLKNKSFEKDYATLLKPYIEKANKK